MPVAILKMLIMITPKKLIPFVRFAPLCFDDTRTQNCSAPDTSDEDLA